jgi:hypothetical protein
MGRMMTQHVGDLVVEEDQEVRGQVTGTTYVRAGATLVARGQLSGGLIVDQGGRAIIHGQVSRNVINHGVLILHGQVSGTVLGNPPSNTLGPDQVVGNDLEVPFRGTTISWSQ